MEIETITNVAAFVAIGALVAAFVLGFIRLVIGPSLPDRVIALDMMAFVVIAFVTAYAIHSDEPAFLNVALALGLVAFLGTIAFARFIERLSRMNAGTDARG